LSKSSVSLKILEMAAHWNAIISLFLSLQEGSFQAGQRFQFHQRTAMQFSHWKRLDWALHPERLICTFGLINGEFMRKLSEMTTPQQRLARMRKSFAKNKSILTVDYKYFTTPDAMPHASTPQSKAARKSAERYAPKSPKWS
jgi:hypothetical protein